MYISWWPSEYKDTKYYIPFSYREDLRREISENSNENLARRKYLPRENQVALPPKFSNKYTKKQNNDDFQETAYTFDYLGKTDWSLAMVEGFQKFGHFNGKVNRVFGTKEDKRICLPIMNGAESIWGLNGFKIAEWWVNKQDKDGYSMYSTRSNCAGTVVQGLIVGGAEAFFTAPKKGWLMLPTNVLDWTSQLAAKITFLNQSMKSALARPIHYRGRPLKVRKLSLDHDNFADLLGGKGTPFWTEFRPLLKSIQAYQFLAWDSQYVEKLKRLVMIFEQSNQILIKHPSSPVSGRLKSIIYTISLLLQSDDVGKTASSREKTLQRKMLEIGGQKEDVFEPIPVTDENILNYKNNRVERRIRAKNFRK